LVRRQNIFGGVLVLAGRLPIWWRMSDEQRARSRALPVPPWLQDTPQPRRPWRKVMMVAAVIGCLALSVLGGLLPILPGWIFFVLGLYILATEFRTGRRWVTSARRRFPWMSRWITRAREHRWAPRHLKEFDDLTNPRR
jgi:hypothetical protein